MLSEILRYKIFLTKLCMLIEKNQAISITSNWGLLGN